MKKLLTLTATCVILATPATAVQKCVALHPQGFDNQDFTCDFRSIDEKVASWETPCDNGITLETMAFCGNSTSDTTFSTTYSSNKHCWCRLIKPVPSEFIYGTAFSDGAECLSYCVEFCSDPDRDTPGMTRDIYFLIFETLDD